MLTDEELISLFHQGHREKAFTALVEKYQQKIYWHIRRMVLEHELANDVLQNTFLKIWNGLENFRAASQLYTWIYRIATNECFTLLNQQKRHKHISFDSFNEGDEEENYFAPSSYIKGDSQPIDSEKLLAKLKAAIETLPDKQRLVFNMRYYDEMSYEQMSEVLGTSVGALKASYFHAAQKIEHFLLTHD